MALINKKEPIVPKQYQDLDEAILAIHNEIEELAVTKLEPSFVRTGIDVSLQRIKDDLKQEIKKFHRIPEKFISDEMLLDYINKCERQRGKDYRIPTLGKFWFRNKHIEMVMQDHNAKRDQLNAIRKKVYDFIEMQESEDDNHDYQTDFSEDVCLYSLQSLVYSYWLNYVEPIAEFSLSGSTNRKFTTWLESNCSDDFVVTCWIALAKAQELIETRVEDEDDEQYQPLHCTPDQIQATTAWFEAEEIEAELDWHEDDLDKLETWLTNPTCHENKTFTDNTIHQIEFQKERIIELNEKLDNMKKLAVGYYE
ncbi:hypothetical protein ACB087_01995 [Vibrio sp. VNB-15]